MKRSKNLFCMAILLSFVSCQQRYRTIESLRSQPIEAPLERAKFSLAKKPLEKNADLKSLLRFAALNNAGLKAEFFNWQMEISQIYPAGALPNAQLSFTHYFDEVETRVGPQEQAVALVQQFPWFGKLELKKALQSKRASAAYSAYQDKKLSLFAEVEKNYYDLYYSRESLKIAEENKRLLLSIEPIARSFIKMGKGALDLIRLQVEIGRIEERISSLHSRYSKQLRELNSLLNRSHDSVFDIQLQLPKRLLKEGDSLYKSLRRNPYLESFDYRIAAAEDKIRLARKNFYPDFSIGVKYIRTTGSLMPTSDSGKDPIMATIGLSLPLDRRKLHHLEDAAVEDFSKLRWQKQEQLRRLESRLASALFELQDNERVLKLYQKTLIPKNRQSWRISQQAYRNAKLGFLDLLEIQKQLLEFQLLERKAIARIYQQEAVIRQLTNMSLIGFEK